MNSTYLEQSDYGTTRRKFLEEELKQAEYNLLCYSRNLVMTEPKVGFNYEWGDAREKVQLITQMLKELPDDYGYSIFVGRPQSWMRVNGAYLVDFEVTSPAKSLTSSAIHYVFKVSERIFFTWSDTYEKGAEVRRQEDKPTLVEIKVKKGFIYEIRWVDNWD